MREFSPEARHPHIDLVQLALRRAGHDPGPIDGGFGPETRAALDAFRQNRGLEIHPHITKADWRAFAPFLLGYVVRRGKTGDSLPSLAEQFRTTVSAIETANPWMASRPLDLERRIVIPLNFPLVPTDIRFTSAALDYTVRGLCARYPRIRRGVLGHAVSGREIPLLLFGSGPHHVSYNAAHHGNEWITTPILLKFLEEYAQITAENGTICNFESTSLSSITTLHLIPMVCPDGVDIATGALDQGPAWEYAALLAENAPQFPFPQGFKANSRGVDLNLQYPAGWEKAREIKFSQGFTTPGPRDYVGKAPLSEPESRALYTYTLQNDFSLTLSYHSQGEIIYWRYLDHLPPHSLEIGRAFARLSGYALEETPYASGHAGYKDWFIHHYNRPAYTIEVGLGESPLPLSQFDNIYRQNKAMLAAALVATAS